MAKRFCCRNNLKKTKEHCHSNLPRHQKIQIGIKSSCPTQATRRIQAIRHNTIPAIIHLINMIQMMTKIIPTLTLKSTRAYGDS